MDDIEIPDVIKPPSVPGMLAAELVVDGLSVFCFNKTDPDAKFWEVCYPRQGRHDLHINIQELDGAGNKVRPERPHPVNPLVERFTISLTNGSLEHYENDRFPEGGPKTAGEFDRNNPDNDSHDLRWMIDLAGDEIEHGEFLALLPRDERHRRSIASIRHSLFCNLEPEAEPARISPLEDNDPDADGNFDLGPTNTFIVGVLLGSDSGHIQFEFDPPLTSIEELEYNENKRYRIEIKNHDTGNPHQSGRFVRGDLRFFYEELIDVSGPEKDLWAIPDPSKEFSPDGDCHPTVFGGATLLP